jgi:drug/metabolite transporter (DMT)-like permease
MPAGAVTGLGLGTAAIWGAADFSGGLAAKRAAPAFVVAVAHGFSLIVLLAAAVFLHAASGLFSLYGVISGVCCGAGLIALYTALSQGSMGLSAATSGVLAAVIPVLYEWLREGRATPAKMAGFAVAAVAIWLVAYTPEQRPSASSEPRPHGLGLAVCAGLCFGAMLILMHLAAAHGVLRAIIAMRISSTSVAAFFAVVLLSAQRQKRHSGAIFPTGNVLLLAILAGVLDTTGNLLYLFASLAGRLDVAAVLSSLYPAGTMLLAAWLLRERATRSQTAGMALAVAAVVLISM